MPNSRYDMHRGYNFFVEINGIAMSFSRVSGLGRSASMQPIQEGGFNGRVHFLRGAIEEQSLTLEYGTTTDTNALDTLVPGRYLPKGVYINVMNDANESSKCSYALDGCYIKRVNFGNLSAMDSALIINTIEITYDHMTYGA